MQPATRSGKLKQKQNVLENLVLWKHFFYFFYFFTLVYTLVYLVYLLLLFIKAKPPAALSFWCSVNFGLYPVNNERKQHQGFKLQPARQTVAAEVLENYLQKKKCERC